MKNLSKIQSVSRKTYDFFTAKWFLTAIVLTISQSWFFVLRSLGKDFNMVDDTNKLTSTFHWLFWPVFLFALLFTLLKTWADNYNQKIKNNGQLILNYLIENINSSMEYKSRRFELFVENNHAKRIPNPFHEITQPRAQIENILENLRETLSNVFGINRSNIGISLVYQVDGHDWEWICSMNVNHDHTLDTLLKSRTSTLYQIINSNECYIFYPDKTVGIRDHKYLPDSADAKNDNVGSILCLEVSVGKNDKHLKAILSINSNGLQFCNVNDRNAIHKIQNILLPSFELRLKNELYLLYIKEVIAV